MKTEHYKKKKKGKFLAAYVKQPIPSCKLTALLGNKAPETSCAILETHKTHGLI